MLNTKYALCRQLLILSPKLLNRKKKESIICRVILTVYVFLFPFGQQEHPAYREVHQSTNVRHFLTQTTKTSFPEVDIILKQS